jgi:hypothetical protein
VRYTCRSISHCGADVLCCEVWIILQEFTLAGALGEFAQDQLDGDSRPLITGFPIMISGLMSIRSVVIAILVINHTVLSSKWTIADFCLLCSSKVHLSLPNPFIRVENAEVPSIHEIRVVSR